MKHPKIYTSRDAFKAAEQAEYQRKHNAALRSARAKVRRWEAKVAKFGGAIHIETLGRLREALAKLEA